MSDTTTRTAGYAPAPGVLTLIGKMRQHTIAGPVDGDLLRRIGVSETLVKRTLNSLRALGLTNEDGSLTESFEALIAARPDDYRQQFAEFLQRAYADVFAVIDPATATTEQLRNAFWGYEPRGQIDQMIRLFIALCEEAGLVEAKPKAAAPANKQREPRTNSRTGRTGSDKPTPPAPQSPFQPSPLDAALKVYIDLLLAKAAEQAEPSADLLDRIERALGIAPAQEASP